MQPLLFTPIKIRDLTFRNRVFVSPMCQYCSEEGMPTDWHLVHLGSRAVGGAGLVMVEATAVTPQGRISPGDSGIWSDAHAEAFKPIAKFIRAHGAVPAIQLAHAGRKASVDAPWRGGGALAPSVGGWTPIAPSPRAFDAESPMPREMTQGDINETVGAFVAAARRSLAAGFEVVELHAAHGYLMHEFLSPLSNSRTDSYGGSLTNRMRFPLKVASAVREVWPSHLPLFVRISATDWAQGGWDLPQSIEFSRALKDLGVDLIDCSSGALVPVAKMPIGPGYQVPFAEAIRREVGISTGAVGLITEAAQAEKFLAEGNADVVLLARAMLRDPYWPLHAAGELGATGAWPQPVRAGRRSAKSMKIRGVVSNRFSQLCRSFVVFTFAPLEAVAMSRTTRMSRAEQVQQALRGVPGSHDAGAALMTNHHSSRSWATAATGFARCCFNAVRAVRSSPSPTPGSRARDRDSAPYKGPARDDAITRSHP